MKYNYKINEISKSISKATISLLIIFATFSTQAQNNDEDEWPEVNFNAAAKIGLFDDSNVAIDAIDRQSAEGDSGTAWNFKLGTKFQINEKVGLRASASLSDKSYSDFDEFDIQTSLLSLQSSYKLSETNIGIGTRLIFTDLGSQKFLSNQHLYLFASKSVSKKWFLRGELNFSEKEFEIQTERDTDRTKLGLAAYHFIDGTRKSISFGVDLANEDSVRNRNEFSRDIFEIKMKYKQVVQFLKKDTKLAAKFSFRSRDYDGIDPRIGQVREDERFRIELSAEYPLTDNLFLLGEYEYSDNQSNLPTSDYSQNLFLIQLGWELH